MPQVVAVSNAEDALDATHGGKFDIAIVDLELPGMSGTELMGILLKRQPEMRVITFSGHELTDDPPGPLGEVRPADAHMCKPSSPTEMRSIISRLSGPRRDQFSADTIV